MPPFFVSLPESVWAEINRRLRAERMLWELTKDQAVLAAFVGLGGNLALWRPGQLGLTALAVVQPESSAEPVAWLSAKGRSQLTAAYERLISGDMNNPPATPPLHPFIEATLAAVALHQRAGSSGGLESVAADAAREPARWRLPLVCLYSLLDDPGELIAALFTEAKASHEPNIELAETAAHVWLCNEAPAALVELAGATAAGLPPALRLAVARKFAASGLPEVARGVADAPLPAHQPPHSVALDDEADALHIPFGFRYLASDIEAVLLSEYSGGARLRLGLGRAVEAAQTLAAELALRLGHTALADGDPVSALAAFQEAQALRPYDRLIEPLIAEARLACGAADEAAVSLSALNGRPQQQTTPRAQLSAARVHLACGRPDSARAAAVAIVQAAQAGQPVYADTLAAASALLAELGEHKFAAQAVLQLIELRPSDARAQATCASQLLAANDYSAAVEAAWQAVGLAPHDAACRRVLAEALARSGESAAAVEQWRRAADLDPDPALKVKLAEAALTAGSPQIALEAARALLDDPEAAGHEAARGGRAHILAGRALAEMGDEAKAFEFFNQATVLAPSSPLPWRAVAAYHRAQGKPEQALAALDAGRQAVEAQSAMPAEAAELYADFAELHAEMNDLPEAVAAMEKATRLAPDRPRYHRRLGDLHQACGSTAAALGALRRAAELAASDADHWHALGAALESAGEFAQAAAAYERARAVGGSSPQLCADLGRLAYQQGNVALARSTLEAAFNHRDSLQAADLEPLLLLAAVYEGAGDYAAALTAYQRAMAIAPGRTDICVRLGVCCLELGQPEAAIAALRDSAERDLDNFELQKTIGRAFAEAQLWVEAELAYEQAARLAPDDHQLLKTLAGVARKSGNTARAEEALRQAIALAPDTPECASYRQQLAELLISQNQLEDARGFYLEAHDLAPDSTSILMGLGQLHLMLDDRRAAAAAFEKAAEIDSRSAEPFCALAEARALLKEFDSAHKAFLRAAELEPRNPVYLRRAGECLMELGRSAQAVALWRKALLANPGDAATHARLGAALASQGRHADALAEFERAAAEAPLDVELAVDAARAALSLGQHARAISHLERAAKCAPNDGVVWHLLGQANCAAVRRDNALSAFQRAARLAPKDGRPHAAAARILADMQRLPEALVAADSALKLSPDDISVLSDVAGVYASAGRMSDAVAAARRVAQNRPADPAAQLALARALALRAENQFNDSTAGMDDESRALLRQSLERAAALGADLAEVREWAGRAQAVDGHPAEAIRLLEAAAADRPSSDIYRALAACYRRTDQLDRARQSIELALARAPSSVSNLIELGLVCLAQDEAAAASAAFQQAIGADARNAAAHQLLGDALLHMGKRDEALKFYEQAIALEPGRADWHYKMAAHYEAARDNEAALTHYQHAAALAGQQNLPPKQTAEYLAGLARALARDGDLEAAREKFEAALALRRDVPAWWEQCGEISLAAGEAARALQCFNHASDLAPASIEPVIGAARAALALGREAEAEQRLSTALRQHPHHAEALLAMADLLARRADYERALDTYNRAAQYLDDPTRALMAQAELLREVGEPAKAIAALKQIIRRHPENDDALGMLGDALVEADRPAEAEEAYRHAAGIAPRKAIHYVRLGRLDRLQGQLDAALGHLQQARELESENPEALRETGLVFEARRQYDRAYTVYKQLMAVEPNRAENFFRGGMALKALRDYAAAAQLFQRAAELDPDDVEAERQRLAVSALGILSGKVD